MATFATCPFAVQLFKPLLFELNLVLYIPQMNTKLDDVIFHGQELINRLPNAHSVDLTVCISLQR